MRERKKKTMKGKYITGESSKVNEIKNMSSGELYRLKPTKERGKNSWKGRK